MFKISQASGKLVCEWPWIAENPDAFRKELGLNDDALRIRVLFGERRVFEGELKPDARFALGDNLKAGAYEVRLYGARKRDGSEKEVWKQIVYHQPTPGRSAEEIDALARRHAPLLIFSREEEYYPLPLGEILRHPVISESKQSIKIKTVFGTQKIPLPELFDFLRYNGHAEYLLDQTFLSVRQSDFLALKGDYRRSVVYYSYMEDRESDRFFINYHMFYSFDPKTGVAKLINVGPHIFDRESLTLVFRGDGTPESAVLSGHLENQTILFLDRLKIWNTGRVRVPHPDPGTSTVKGHVMAMVAQGSHAIYPCAGLFHISVLSELAGHVFRSILPLGKGDEKEPPEMSMNQVLLPPDLNAQRFASYELRPLRLDLLQSEPAQASSLYDPDTTCLTFSGFWVDVPGPSNARFPPFTRREVEVEDWIDNAYDWQWPDLPKGVLANNQEIANFIESQLD